MPAAVNVLEWEATRKRCLGVSGSPERRSATPLACSRTISPSRAIAKATPGWLNRFR
jgi:hypothetical protein